MEELVIALHRIRIVIFHTKWKIIWIHFSLLTKQIQIFSNIDKEDLQKVWKGIKEIINIKNNNIDFPTCISHNDQYLMTYSLITDNVLENRKYGSKASFNGFLGNPVPN